MSDDEITVGSDPRLSRLILEKERKQALIKDYQAMLAKRREEIRAIDSQIIQEARNVGQKELRLDFSQNAQGIGVKP